MTWPQRAACKTGDDDAKALYKHGLPAAWQRVLLSLIHIFVDVSQDVIVREEDCFASRGETPKGMLIEAIMDGNKVVEKFGDRILGRYTVDPVFHPETGELICAADTTVSYTHLVPQGHQPQQPPEAAA